MRQIREIRWAALLVLLALSAACSSKATDPASALICLSLQDYGFTEFGGMSDSVLVTTCGTAEVHTWSVTASAAWLTLSATTGTTSSGFVISADTNRSGTDRSGTVTVIAEGDPKSARTIALYQPTTASTLCLSETGWTAPTAGGESPLVSINNCGSNAVLNWVVVRRPSWVQMSDSAGATPKSITLRVDTNKTSVTRVDTVAISTCYTCVLERIVVSQEPITRPWTVRDTMPSAGWGFGAATINGKIYVIGGGDAAGVGPWEYDATAQTWTPKTPLPMDQAFAAVAELNGSMYFIGGQDYSNVILSTTVSYAASTDRWAGRAALPAAISAGAACALNGKVYFAGGFNYARVFSDVSAYDPAANAWTTQPYGLLTARSGLAMAAAGGKLYAIGGDLTDAVEEYDPATGRWTSKARMPTPRRGLVAATIAGRIYAIGGFDAGRNPLNVVEEYDPATDAWAIKTPMPTRRAHAAAAVLDGRVYVFGGNTACPPSRCTFPNGWASGAVEVYDPAEDVHP